MNSDKKVSAKLPDGWVLCTSKSNPGRKYYFNRKTGKSSWTQPQADPMSDNKQKGKKEKATVREKCRKEECQKKNLKRKSDGDEKSQVMKKQREEPQTSNKQNKSKKETVKKCPESAKKKSPVNSSPAKASPVKPSPAKASPSKPIPKQSPIRETPTKNLANSRLSQLRAQLATNQTEETDKSPAQGNARASPSQLDTQTKIPKQVNTSPTINDTKSTTQSPSSDSFQSMPSPSQFFAANKIISSMKAQLPEEYCNKSKQKDTFADIEEGICNQTAEYPFMKHPATPPQFSEASKLVSAIKSKLTYNTYNKDKVLCKEEDVKTFAKAKDRLENLRVRLSSEAMNHDDSYVTEDVSKDTAEAMEVDFKETLVPVTQTHQITPDSSKKPTSSLEEVVLVVDTNIFIHELEIIKNVLNSHIKGYKNQPTVLIPWRVISELDRLKDNNNGNGAICKRAKSAMDYLYKSLPEERRIKGQSLRDANSHIYPCEVPDDEILNCCLQQAERGKSVILLSNDKNLCIKASVNSIKSIDLSELKSLLENKPRPVAEPDLCATVQHCRNTIYELLANILENEMRAKYNDLWQYVLFKAPPWTLADVLQCLLKHWIAVFNDVFPRIEHLITDLKASLNNIESKDLNTVSKSEVSNFKELCLDVAKRCQIIPEYMELAKCTVERLQRGGTDDGMLVIDAFEGLWTVFSSYCAKLCSSVSVPHALEDRLGGADPPASLRAKLPVFSEHITMLSVAIKGVLSVETSDESMEEHMVNFENTFMECLALICIDGSLINRYNLRVFCAKCRNMLQEAYSKFSQLMELLEVCKNCIASN